jgi:hypothetical protein
MLAKGKPHKWRKPTIAITVVVLLGSLLWACHTPAVAESDVPAFAIAPYPGATITYRHWTNEDHGRTLDNRKYAQAAQLGLEFKLEAATRFESVVSWYRDILRANGYGDCPPVQYGSGVVVVGCKTIDGHKQRLKIGAVPGTPSNADLTGSDLTTEYGLDYVFV